MGVLYTFGKDVRESSEKNNSTTLSLFGFHVTDGQSVYLKYSLFNRMLFNL